MSNGKLDPQAIFSASPIIPVMQIEQVEHALPMVEALLAGGISVFEITLRTQAAFEAIALIADAYPKALIGAGTVLDPKQYDKAAKAGAQFIFSPGMTVDLIEHAKKSDIPFIPGVATPSEVMSAVAQGFQHLKFFPAEANGGARALAAIAAPLSQVKFFPTGGISPLNLTDYIALNCVVAVGGTWMLPKANDTKIDWNEITEKTKQALALVNAFRFA